MTFIDGIGASENIDSTGERILIAGMDISQLPIDGVFNWEHHKDVPSQVVGKVLFAKKIFSDKDCEDDRQAYFWQKCQVPFVYVMGELFDDYKESSKEVAGMFRYDFDKKDQNERNVMNFSIEGAKLEKQGIDIVKSIARKVTITVLPANKAAIAEIVPAKTGKAKDDLDGLFKTETTVEIELIKSEDLSKVMENLKKNSPHLKLVPPHDPRGSNIGKTKSGKDVFSQEKVHNYQGFSSQDHKDAANFHYNSVKAGTDVKINQHHMNKMKLHMQASQSAERRENRGANAVATARANSVAARSSASMSKPHASVNRPYAKVGDLNKKETGAKHKHKHIGWDKLHSKLEGEGYSKESADKIAGAIKAKVHPMNKAMTAGSQNAAPGDLTNGAAIQTEDKSFSAKKKKKDFWLARAEEEYSHWDKKEQFREFMKKRMPSMTKSQIDAFGATLALKKSLNAESLLNELNKQSTDTVKKIDKK